MKKIWDRLEQMLGGDRYFYVMLVFFAIGASWIAMTSIFPGAFDEEFHLGIIRYFAQHPNPFFGSQPTYLDQFGPVAHNSSYAYHFIMSLPWKLIAWAVKNFTVQIIVMRLINVAMFTYALSLFRKVLLRASKSKSLSNLTLTLVIFTPITTQLAAQINYDNMLLVLLALSLLMVTNIYDGLIKGYINVWRLGQFIFVLSVATLVKFTFLTVDLALVLYLMRGIRIFKQKKNGGVERLFKSGLQKLSITRQIFLILLIVLSVGLLSERYGMNFVRYRAVNPNCVQVIGQKRCEQYSIYQRGIIYENNKPSVINKNPVRFTYLWLKHMNYNLMMVINGPASGYSIGLPLPLPYFASIIMGIGGLILCLVYWRKVFDNAYARLFLLILLAYLIPLWLANYSGYVQTGRRVAIQGRYLVPLLPMLYFLFLFAFRHALRTWPKLQKFVVLILVLCFIVGGGVFTFIVHSDNAWYWRGNRTAITINEKAQMLLRPVIPGATRYSPYWQNSLSF